mmetsp:Transcript_43892/g.110653  ORF Transcript_43892/g.110653 Transcript_43892/m.110653 type:complete len:202 (-) Transcript_43892:866-1471(-)
MERVSELGSAQKLIQRRALSLLCRCARRCHCSREQLMQFNVGFVHKVRQAKIASNQLYFLSIGSTDLNKRVRQLINTNKAYTDTVLLETGAGTMQNGTGLVAEGHQTTKHLHVDQKLHTGRDEERRLFHLGLEQKFVASTRVANSDPIARSFARLGAGGWFQVDIIGGLLVPNKAFVFVGLNFEHLEHLLGCDFELVVVGL